MKKFGFVVISAVLIFMTLNADAQTLVRASIPFSFNVHEKTMPAGQYELTYLGSSFVRLQVVKGNDGVTLFAPSAIRESTGMTFTFRQYGEQRFLSSIADPTLHYRAEIPKSNHEREMQKSYQTATLISMRVHN